MELNGLNLNRNKKTLLAGYFDLDLLVEAACVFVLAPSLSTREDIHFHASIRNVDNPIYLSDKVLREG